jgi:hypothetical protein
MLNIGEGVVVAREIGALKISENGTQGKAIVTRYRGNHVYYRACVVEQRADIATALASAV